MLLTSSVQRTLEGVRIRVDVTADDGTTDEHFEVLVKVPKDNSGDVLVITEDGTLRIVHDTKRSKSASNGTQAWLAPYQSISVSKKSERHAGTMSAVDGQLGKRKRGGEHAGDMGNVQLTETADHTVYYTAEAERMNA